MKKILLLLLMVLTIFMTSCEATIITSESYKVKFDTDRGSYVESQYIKGGQCATLPATPIKSDYDFEYWMLNGKEFDFSTPITSNITLVAKWKLSDNHVCSYISTIYKATCVQPGYTVYKCSICNDTYQDNYIDELGHNLTTHAAKEPTEYSVGWNEYVTCSRCDYTTFVEIPKLSMSKIIYLTYSGTKSDKEFNQSLFELFKADRKAKGDKNTYIINYFECGPDVIDSKVLDWDAPNAPDVYEAASDKIHILFEKGALAKVTGTYKQFIETEMHKFASKLVTLNGDIFAYPYTGDNTYYLQYDASVFTADEVTSMESLLAAAAKDGVKVGYNLETAYWGGAAMFTFGADYEMVYDKDGKIIDIYCDFNSAKGLKAAKAIYNIMHHEAWVNESGVPGAGSLTKAVIGGTWDIESFKEAWGENYACAKIPTVTVDGETATLGCFLGGKFLGVNPQVSQGDVDRFVAANQLAKFLAGHEAQTLRYEEFGVFPCIVSAQNHKNMQGDPNIAVLKAQYGYARPQSAVPGTFWNAPTALIAGIKDGTITEDELQDACDNFNAAIKAELKY